MFRLQSFSSAFGSFRAASVRKRSEASAFGTAVLSLVATVLVTSATVARADGSDQTVDDALRGYLSGNGFLNRGLYELAVAEYRSFLDQHEDHAKVPLARYGLSVSLFRMGRFDEAADELTTLRKRLEGPSAPPDFEFTAEVGTILGQCHLAKKRYRKAGKSFQQVVRHHGDHDLADEAGVGVVEAFYLQGVYDVAVEAAERFVSRWPDSRLRPRTEFFWGLSEMAREEYGRAAEHFAELLKREPDGALTERASLLLARCYERDNAVERAIRGYRRVLKRTGSRFAGDALLSLGLLLHRQGQLNDAGRYLDRLIQEIPESKLIPAARLLRGRVWFDKGRFDRASSSFEKVAGGRSIVEGPRSKVEGGSSKAADRSLLCDEAEYWLAKCELRRNQPGEAARRLRGAIVRYDDSRLAPEMHYDLGVALLQSGDPEAAIEAFQAFKSRFPQHDLVPDALHLLAMTEHRQRRWDRSLEHCGAFMDRVEGRRSKVEGHDDDDSTHPLAPRVAFLAAENRFLAEQYEPAVTAYQGFLQQYPNSAQTDKAKLRLGSALHRLERFDEAGPVLNDLVEPARKDATLRPALWMLGDIHFQRNEWKQAQRYLSGYLRAGLDVASAADALLKLGLCLQRQSKSKEALSAFDRFLAHFDDGGHLLQVRFERGQALVALGRIDEAAKAFQQVLDEGTDSRFASHALNHLAAIATQRHQHDKAAELYRKVLQVADATGSKVEGGKAVVSLASNALFLRGQSLMGAQDFRAAEKVFERFLKQHPSHEQTPVARAHLAVALSRQNRYDDALKVIQRCGQDSGTLPPSLRAAMMYEKAWCLRELGRSDEAAEVYRALINAKLGGSLTAHAMLELGGIEQSAGRYKPAAKVLRRLREVLVGGTTEPPHGVPERATYQLAVCEFELDRWDEAARLFQEFLAGGYSDSPLLASAAFHAGEALFQLSRYESAAQHLQRVVDNYQEHAVYAPSLLRLGECQAALQRWSAGERTFAKYLERFADGEQWYQAQFGVGWACEHQKRYAEAISAYGKVVSRHQGPTAARAQFQIGQCLYAQKQYNEAVRALLKVDILYAYPEWSAAALFEAGRCFEELNKTAEAREHFQQVTRKYEDTRWAPMAARRLSTLSSASLPGR